jgi:hypothetical protein
MRSMISGKRMVGKASKRIQNLEFRINKDAPLPSF